MSSLREIRVSYANMHKPWFSLVKKGFKYLTNTANVGFLFYGTKRFF